MGKYLSKTYCITKRASFSCEILKKTKISWTNREDGPIHPTSQVYLVNQMKMLNKWTVDKEIKVANTPEELLKLPKEMNNF